MGALRFPASHEEPVDDAYEESEGVAKDNLGGVDRKQSRLQVTLEWSTEHALGWLETKRVPERQGSVTVDVLQDLHRLHAARGDTGSVLWRVNFVFARMYLSQQLLPQALQFMNFSECSVLELGAGTGFLASVLADEASQWYCTDVHEALKLIQRNVEANKKDVHIEEVDWIDVAENPMSYNSLARTAAPDVMLALDCIYNPYLSKPLARTIDALAGAKTQVLVCSELRDEDPLLEFLEEWLALGWDVTRIRLPSSLFDDLPASKFVLWLGKRKAAAGV